MEKGLSMAKILICDDALFARTATEKMVNDLGHEIVESAENGEQAVEAYKKYHPDLVLMDINMPGMNGLDALKAIRAYDPHARVVMLSAMGQQHNVYQAIEFGAVDFVTKPVSPELFEQALTKDLTIPTD